MFAAGRLTVVVAVFVAGVLTAGPVNALLLGEKARFAPLASLQSALQLYKSGGTHEMVWRQTGWHCPLRERPCRWEIAGNCTDFAMINVVAIEHTSFTGKVPMWKVFNVACIWQQYPQLRDRVFVYFGDCGGWGGFARPDFGKGGEVCLNGNALRRIRDSGSKTEKAHARKWLHRVFIHELQHHIQFAEQWPAPPDHAKCPYDKRAIEREAAYVHKRTSLSKTQKRKSPPLWYSEGLC